MSRLVLLLLPAAIACGPVTDFNGYTELTGSLTYRTETTAGEVVCDVDLELVGTPYTGSCSDCEFAFHVDPTVIDDRGTDDCVLPSLWTYVDDDFIGNSGLGYADATANIDGEPLDRALVAVGDLEGTRPTSAGIVQDGQAFTEVSWDGVGTMRWEHRFEELTGENWLWDRPTCTVDDLPELKGKKVEGGYSGTGSLDCAGFIVDVWSFEGRAGERVELALDTVSDDSAFDTTLIVEGPDGCLVAEGDDVFQCSFAPSQWSCGGGKFTPDQSGTHRVIAWSLGSCTAPDTDQDGWGDRADYRLAIAADYDPQLTQVEDDLPLTEELLVSTVSGSVDVVKGAQ